MRSEDDLSPHLGRIRDLGRSGARRFVDQIKRAGGRLGTPRRKPGYTGRYLGTGSAKARQLIFRKQRFADFRSRRVVVKVHIARASRAGGIGAFRAHLNYLQRDGVDRDGAGGELYSKESSSPDVSTFLENSNADRHQFRIIISPEDGEKIGDLKSYTRAFMNRVQSDLGQGVDWVAVDHFNTGQPHTHVIIRGKDNRGKDLVISPEYLTSGLRVRAGELATEILGPRRDVEIARAKYSEVHKDRYTQIDRRIERMLSGSDTIQLPSGDRNEADRFQRTLIRRRMTHLSALGLANEEGSNRWVMTPDWSDTLRALGRRGDVIRSLANKFARYDGVERIQLFDLRTSTKDALIGTVLANIPHDELAGTRSLVLEDRNAKRWIVEIGRGDFSMPPPEEALVEIRAGEARVGAADRTIDALALETGGKYSDALHKAHDAASSSEYRRAHVRRLEALRRQGVVQRSEEGVWTIPKDYLARVQKYEQSRSGAHRVIVHSWISLDDQVNHKGPTWLDTADHSQLSATQKEALAARHDWLREHGLLASEETRLGNSAMRKLSSMEIAAVEARLSNLSGREAKRLQPGDKLHGQYEGVINLGTRRMARIGNAEEFVLVPWRQSIERARGRDLIARRTASGVSWTIGRGRNLDVT